MIFFLILLLSNPLQSENAAERIAVLIGNTNEDIATDEDILATAGGIGKGDQGPVLVIRETYFARESGLQTMQGTWRIAIKDIEGVALYEDRNNEHSRRYYLIITYSSSAESKDAFAYDSNNENATSSFAQIKAQRIGVYTQIRAQEIKDILDGMAGH